MINSKNILSRTTKLFLILVLGGFVSSCAIIECEECDKNVPKEIEKISEGDFAAYKRFMQKHPDPEFSCCIRNSVINSVNYNTIGHVRASENLEITKDFFNYELSQDTKNEFLSGYWRNNRDKITKFLIKNDAKLVVPSFIDSTFCPGLKKMKLLGYDMNHIDPKSGRNLFLDFSAMGYENKKFKGGEQAIECLNYLKSIGADTKLKDAKGKTALEIASDPKIIEYLKTL